MKSANRGDQPPFLIGWKEIANYLGRGIRTVQRYERTLGMPVRRSSGRSPDSVLATKAELDAWIAARPLAPSFALPQTHLHLATLEIFRSALAEQHRLREELTTLRESLHSSLEMLRATMNSHANVHEKFKQTSLRFETEYRKPN